MATTCQRRTRRAVGFTMDLMRTVDAVTIVHDEQELFQRTKHLFMTATEIACAANDLWVWAWRHQPYDITALSDVQRRTDMRVRKIYRADVLLDRERRTSWPSAATS